MRAGAPSRAACRRRPPRSRTRSRGQAVHRDDACDQASENALDMVTYSCRGYYSMRCARIPTRLALLVCRPRAAMNVLVIVNPVSGRHGADASRLASLSARATDDARVARRARRRCGRPSDRATRRSSPRRRPRQASIACWPGAATARSTRWPRRSRSVRRRSAIVPAGSGNGLARELRVPLDPMRAIRAAVTGAVRQIDVGEIDGRRFLNVAGIGVDAPRRARLQRRADGTARPPRLREDHDACPARVRTVAVHADGGR